MWAFVKSFATYRTIRMAAVISSALTLDSLSAENSTVTVVGTEIGQSDAGNWLVIDGGVYSITGVKPQTDRTLLTLTSPLDAFSRPLELAEQTAKQTVGNFIVQQLTEHWIECTDTAYALPYLTVSNLDTTAFSPPELDNNDCYKLSEYARLMRRSYRVTVRFSDGGDELLCNISTPPIEAHNISFDDGKSQLQNLDYSASGTAKLTVLCDVATGEKDDDGEPIVSRQRSTWYLAEDGTVSQTVPARRASGTWDTISVKKLEEVEAKVIETFAKNKTNHKLEFWSTLNLNVQDNCTFYAYGEILRSYISYKRKSSEDSRYYYKSGELATTATEKLRGVIK